MVKFAKAVKRYLIMYLIFIKYSLIGEMEYRTNFIAGLAVETGYTLVKLIYVFVIIKTGVHINGLSPYEILLYIGTYTLLSGMMVGILWNNLLGFPEYIRTGTLDMYLVKPISAQFIITLRRISFGTAIPHFISGSFMLVISVKELNLQIGLADVLIYVLLILSGLVVMYSLFMFFQILSFWVVNTESIMDITNEVWEFNNMPMTNYSQRIRRIGIFILPIFMISNCPSLFLLDRLSVLYLAWAFIAPILFFFITRSFWNFAIKKYSSASS